MIVDTFNLAQVVDCLKENEVLSLDTETTGLRPYHGDQIFSLIIAVSEIEAYYFNFNYDPKVSSSQTLCLTTLPIVLQPALFDREDITWVLHNAKFDMHMLKAHGCELKGKIHCTRSGGRIVYNEYFKYDLGSSLERIGLKKDDAVENYIKENKLYVVHELPGKQIKLRIPQYQKVPFDIIVPYGIMDAKGTYALGLHQDEKIKKEDDLHELRGLPTLRRVLQNEQRLTKTVFRMEHLGVKIDRPYCERAARYEHDRARSAEQSFERETNRSYLASPKLFAEIFASEKEKWEYTEKGNPSFDTDTLKKFDNPAAKLILEIRDAKSKADFYNGFLYHADKDDLIHPNFNPDGTATGRLSSSDPNFQNLTSEEGDEDKEFLIRRAIIPRVPGNFFIMPDYDQMEYRMMLELAARLVGHTTELIEAVKSGLDVHEATAQAASRFGTPISRSAAKTVNFLTIYGGGNAKLADSLKCSLEQAAAIRGAVFKAAPEIKSFIKAVMQTAETRGFIFNWLGRRSYFPDSRFAYKAPNYLIQGGCADVMKVAMNEIDEFLLGKKSKMVMTIHDELVLECHPSEIEVVPKFVKEVMENTFESRFLKLTAGMEHSFKSLGDKVKGFPA